MDVGIDETFEPWSSKRTSILSTYTTSQRIPITTSFLPSEEREKCKTLSLPVLHVYCTLQHLGCVTVSNKQMFLRV